MKNFCFTFISLALLVTVQLNAQSENGVADMNFKLKLMEDQVTWGVFVVPGESIVPTKRSKTGSGQVTIVAPVGFVYAGFESIGGTWIENARVDGPMEAPEKAYISFGFVSDEPRIKYAVGSETLLFTFIPEESTTELGLIDNENDPFSAPNTYSSNPGNDLGVIDFDTNGNMLVYHYGDNLETEGNSGQAIFASKKATETEDRKDSEFKVIFASEKTEVPGN